MKCAYCGKSDRKLTREHLFPRAIDALFFERFNHSHYYLHRSPKRFLEGEPTIKDVCETCNNDILGKLDSYAFSFIRDNCMGYFSASNQVHRIQFAYDLVLRWILKVSYNSARVHNTQPDCEMLSVYKSYILGHAKTPNRIALFARGIYSHKASDEEVALVRGQAVDDNNVLHPHYLRNSIVRFTTRIEVPKVARAFTFQAYQFIFLVLPKKVPHKIFMQFIQEFKAYTPDAVLISPLSNSIAVAAGVRAFDAIKGHFIMREDDYGEKFFEFIKSKFSPDSS